MTAVTYDGIGAHVNRARVTVNSAGVTQLADVTDSNSVALRGLVGSNPTTRIAIYGSCVQTVGNGEGIDVTGNP